MFCIGCTVAQKYSELLLHGLDIDVESRLLKNSSNIGVEPCTEKQDYETLPESKEKCQ
jgi:hypothetical protein